MNPADISAFLREPVDLFRDFPHGLLADGGRGPAPAMTGTLTQITRLVALVFFITSMAGIGLGLTARQLAAPLKDVRLVGTALFANFIVSPVLAWLIARLLRLDEPFAIGLMLLGLAGGAPFMPKIAGVAKGDPALAVGLMVLLMAATTVVLPVALPLLIAGAQVDAWEIARFLVLLLLLPLVAGLAIRARRESAAARLQPVLGRISTLALLLMLVLIITLQFQGMLQLIGSGAILAALLFALLSSLAGWSLGGLNPSRRTALGLATGLRNLPAALVVSVQNFKDPKVPLMVLVTTLTGLLILVPAARHAGRRTTDAPP